MDSDRLLPGPCFCLVDTPREGLLLVLSVTEASLALIIFVTLHILHQNKHHCYERLCMVFSPFSFQNILLANTISGL